MLTQTITQYLGSHKRLIIPQLGAFIVKTPGESIVFSELLKRDDGVLRGLLVSRGITEIEAAGEIDRFVFEVRHAVGHGREYSIVGLGAMHPGPNGTIAFEYKPGIETPLDHQMTTPPPSTNPAARTFTIPDLKISTSPKINPEPCVKGLRYGKPHKPPRSYSYTPGGHRRIDRFLIIAIAAAVVAVAAIAFGYLRSDDKAATEPEPTEQIAPGTEAAPQTSNE